MKRRGAGEGREEAAREEGGACCPPSKRVRAEEGHPEPYAFATRAVRASGAVLSAPPAYAVEAYEAALAATAGAEHGLAFSSGGAAAAAVVGLLGAEDHIVVCDDAGGGTARLLQHAAAPGGAGPEATRADFCDLEALEAAVRPRTMMLWLETPSRATLKVADVRAVAALAHRHQVALVVDSPSPVLQSPLALGADVALHGPGARACAGGVVTSNERILERLRFVRGCAGSSASPLECVAAAARLCTLHVCARERDMNAAALATFADAHPKVAGVVYPGLRSHPQHETAKRQMSGFGGDLSFVLAGGATQAAQFLGGLQLVAVSAGEAAPGAAGGTATLVEHQAGTLTEDEQRQLGVSPSLVRVSAGIEDVADVIADFGHALEGVALDGHGKAESES